ncbi:hypothetical protein SAMN04487928_10435 [Butyrivibrio proteoclasticus]|uniref:Uncharacterized protein n=1 Tax=Butyrivibrio proteoclasticus TaxID=43305 RepID=A0A1I5RHS2_9FIRM|nr:hypothetical protein SAMN04487928_10435 [Butyrivibrio proteoclasticus]
MEPVDNFVGAIWRRQIKYLLILFDEKRIAWEAGFAKNFFRYGYWKEAKT